MNPIARIAVAAVAIVIAVGGAVYLLSPGGNVGGPPAASPSATPSAARSASPSPSSGAVGPLDTTTWTTYTSARYGFSIGRPPDWTERSSDHVWAFPADADWMNTASESFVAPGATVRASAWSVSVAPGTTVDSWLQAYCPKNTTPCTGLQARTRAVSMDGHPGLLIQFAEDTQTFILVANRMYIVAVWEPDSDPRTQPYGGAVRLLEGYLSTVRLLPGGPAASETPGPS